MRAVGVFVRSDAGNSSQLVGAGRPRRAARRRRERVPLTELPAVHAKADAGALPGKVVVVVETS